MRKIAFVCLRLAVVASFSVSMGLSAVSPASAFTGDQVQHVIDCLGLMFSNPAQHAIECGPGHQVNGPDAKAYSFEPAPPAPACPDITTNAPLWSGSPDAQVLLVGRISDCCSTPESYQPSAPGFVQIIPVITCCPPPISWRGPTDGAPDLLIQVVCLASSPFDGFEIPGLTV